VSHFDVTTLTLDVGNSPEPIAEELTARLSSETAPGVLLGCWIAEFALHNRLFVLREFSTSSDREEERRRCLMEPDPFGLAGHIVGTCFESFEGFPGLPHQRTGALGPIYEVRTYHLKPGCLSETLAAWAEMVPRRATLSAPVAVMYALDGPPRFLHIWAYESLEKRLAIRREALRANIWPPRSAPATLTTAMGSELYLPTNSSPLR
jgi:hypothetical protein